MNQCPYCKERYSDAIIMDHLVECAERPSKCELCLETILPKDKLNHETRACKMIHGKGNLSGKIPRSHNKSRIIFIKK